MKEKLLFFINPISGTRKKNSLPEIIVRECTARGYAVEVLPTCADGAYSQYEKKIQDEKIQRIGICGGDGTVNQVVQALAHLPVAFGILPLGSGNGLAFSAGIPRNFTEALQRFFEGEAKATDAFRVNEQFACMLCGLGLDAQVAHEFADQPTRGLGTYAKLTTKAFFSARTYPFTIKANGLSFESEAFFISIANSNQFGNNFTIAPEASLGDGLLDIVIVKKMARPTLLISLLRQLFSGRIRKVENSLRRPLIYFQTKKLEVLNPELAPMHIDGEPRKGEKKIEVEILPGFFQLIQ